MGCAGHRLLQTIHRIADRAHVFTLRDLAHFSDQPLDGAAEVKRRGVIGRAGIGGKQRGRRTVAFRQMLQWLGQADTRAEARQRGESRRELVEIGEGKDLGAIRESLAEPVNQILNGIKLALENTPPELSADIVDKGIVLAGGGALLKGMDVFLREETSLPIIIAEDPLTCVALGAGKVLDDEDILKKVMM